MAEAGLLEEIDRSERRWALFVALIVALLLVVIIATGLHWAAEPPSNVETIDASRLHLAGEFMEANLGTSMQPDGSAIVRVLAQQYSFVPQCIVVPARTDVTLRITSPDVVHGSLIASTNVYGMGVPGFVSQVRGRFERPGWLRHLPRILQRRLRGACGRGSGSSTAMTSPGPTARGRARRALANSGRVLAHFWAAFSAFAVALPLGAWQMVVRSPLHRWVDPELYYRSVTAHGTSLAYVFPTLVAMGFGYAACTTALGRPLHRPSLAWLAFALVVSGALVALATVAAGRADVLYTFYPPLAGSPFYYLGVLVAIAGSWIWVGLMAAELSRWKREHPALPVPLAMFATVAGALLWAWTSLGVGCEIVFLILRTSWLHGDHRRGPRAHPLRGRCTHRLFLADPGVHRVLRSPAAGRRRAPVQRSHGARELPAAHLLDAHRLPPSVRRPADRRRVQVPPHGFHRHGGRAHVADDLHDLRFKRSRTPARRPRRARLARGAGRDRPLVLASAMSFVMLGLGGASGLINMSYALNSTIHNTQWVTGHFHLIYGGAVVIMYFAIAYELWPRLTSRPLAAPALVRVQLWSWFAGMLLTTLPWHAVGTMGQPRRMAYYDYANPALAPQAAWVAVSAIGGIVLVFSALLLLGVPRLHTERRAGSAAFSLAVRPPRALPASLNGFRVWTLLVVALTITNYGYPIVQSLMMPGSGVAYRVGTR